MAAPGGSSIGNVTIAVNTVYNGKAFERAQRDIAATKGAALGATTSTMAMGAGFERAGKRMSSLGKSLTIGVTAPLALIGAKSFQAAHEFQTSMNRMVSLSGITRKEMEKMTQPALDMGSKYGIAGNEAAEALYFIASSGFNATQSMKVLEASMMASATGMGEVKEIADLVTSGISAYGKTNLNASQAVDIMAVAIREGKMESDEMAKTMGSLIPIASELDISFADTAGAMAVMSRAGADAFKGATQLRGIMSALLKPSVQGAEALKEVGLSAEGLRNEIKQKGLYSALMTIRKELGNNKEALAKVFPNVRGLAGFLNLMGKQAKNAGRIMRETNNAVGEGVKAFKKIEGTPQFKYEQAVAGLKNAMIQLGIAITPIVIPVLQAIRDIANAFLDLPQPVQKVILIFAGIAAVVGPLLIVFGAVASAIGTIVTVVSTAAGIIGTAMATFGAMASLVGIFGAVKIAIVALFTALRVALITSGIGLILVGIGVAAYMLIKHWDTVKAALAATWDWIKTAASNLATFVSNMARKGFLGPIPWIIANWGKVKSFLGNVWSFIKNAFSAGASFIVSAARRGFLGPTAWIIANWGKVRGFISGAWGAIKAAFSAGAAFIVSAARRGFLGPVAWIIANWNKVTRFFSQLPGKIGNAISGLASIILSPFRSAASAISGVLDGIISTFQSAVDRISSIANGIKGAVGKAGSALGLSRGGVAGPGRGGVAIVGEGNKPEWVISQEGSRDKNIDYLLEAAGALGVPMMAEGGRTGDPNNSTRDRGKRRRKKDLQKLATPGKVREREIALARAELTDTKTDDITAVENLVKLYKTSVDGLQIIFQKWTLKDWKQQYPNTKNEKNRWKTKKNEFRDQLLGDLRNLKQYKDQLADLTTVPPVDETESTAPSISAQIGAFSQERMAMLTSFAGNIRSRSSANLTPTSMNVGGQSLAYGGQISGGTNAATGTNVSITQNYQEPPQDPHAWTREIQNEITALM